MSLINQMLKDLDARRSDVSGGGSFGQQIRAVPERSRIHPAWWVALALGGMLIGVVGYVLLRPEPPAPVGMSARLPLKLDVGLTGAQPPNPIAAPAAPATPPVPVPVPQPVVEASPKPAAPLREQVQLERKPVQTKLQVAAQPVKERAPAPVPTAAEVVPPVKAMAPVPASKPSEAIIPPTLNKQVKELTPAQRAENDYRKAILALQQGKRAEAISGLEQALQVESKHAGARQALIGLLLDAKQQDDAMQRAREGLNADPAQTGLAMILARLQLEKGELRPAIETLERSLPHAMEKADYVAFLAALLQRDGRHKQAVEYYLLALQKSPQNGVWWMGLGISLQAEQRNPEAYESFRRAKASNSLSSELLAFVEGRISQLQP